MRLRHMLLSVVCCLTILGGAARAYAQHSASEIMVKVGFEFVAGDRTYPAGTYRLTRNASGPGALKIAAASGDPQGTIQVMTRISEDVAPTREPRAALVFDKVNDKAYLSEVWMAGEDGYLVRGTPEEHQHLVVRPGQ
jgi:hypothetical protein